MPFTCFNFLNRRKTDIFPLPASQSLGFICKLYSDWYLFIFIYRFMSWWLMKFPNNTYRVLYSFEYLYARVGGTFTLITHTVLKIRVFFMTLRDWWTRDDGQSWRVLLVRRSVTVWDNDGECGTDGGRASVSVTDWRIITVRYGKGGLVLVIPVWTII